MSNFPILRSINEPYTSRQSFTPVSPNEPPQLPAIGTPTPVITSMTPTEATIGDETFTLEIAGQNFFAGTVINFAGYDEPTTRSGNTVSTIVNMDYWHGPDALPVYVHNGEKVSNEVTFTFHPPAIDGTALDTEAAENLDLDYEDPDEMEDELEAAEEDGDYQTLHRGRPANTLSNKRSKAARLKK